MEMCRGTLYQCSLQLIPESLISREKGKKQSLQNSLLPAMANGDSLVPWEPCAPYVSKQPVSWRVVKDNVAIHYIDPLCPLSAPYVVSVMFFAEWCRPMLFFALPQCLESVPTSVMLQEIQTEAFAPLNLWFDGLTVMVWLWFNVT